MTMTTKKIKLCAFHLMGGSSQERFFCFLLSCMIAVLLVVAAPLDANAAGNPKGNPICAKLGISIQASAGAQMFCKGPQNGATATTALSSSTGAGKFGSNVDAAAPSEDVTPNGVQMHGQSEVSIAAAGP